VRRERASMIDPSKEPYDVLVDDYSAGLTAARIDEIFGEVKMALYLYWRIYEQRVQHRIHRGLMASLIPTSKLHSAET